MSGELPLFDGAGIAVPVAPGPSLRTARGVVADVEALQAVMDETFRPRCKAVAREAEKVGAHSLARACRWMAHPASFDSHGYDQVHIRVERIAHRWLRRVETARRPTPDSKNESTNGDT